jgi:putative ABC transport system permease protein
VDTSSTLAMRSDVALTLTEPSSRPVRHELLRLPGVLAVESTRFVPVTLVNGTGANAPDPRPMPPAPELYRIIDMQGKADRCPATAGA